MPISNFQPVRLLDPGCWYKFTHFITNSADPDQLACWEEAKWPGSTLFAKAGYIRVQQDEDLRSVKIFLSVLSRVSWRVCGNWSSVIVLVLFFGAVKLTYAYLWTCAPAWFIRSSIFKLLGSFNLLSIHLETKRAIIVSWTTDSIDTALYSLD